MTVLAAVRPGPSLHVDLDAVAANTRLFAARTPGALMAVVKADGFGHGAAAVARTALAHGASWLGVTSVDEALALRADGLRAPVLSWLNPVDADFVAGDRRGRRPRRPEPRPPGSGEPQRRSAPACTSTSTRAWPATARRRPTGRRCAGRPGGRSGQVWCGSSA